MCGERDEGPGSEEAGKRKSTVGRRWWRGGHPRTQMDGSVHVWVDGVTVTFGRGGVSA